MTHTAYRCSPTHTHTPKLSLYRLHDAFGMSWLGARVWSSSISWLWSGFWLAVVDSLHACTPGCVALWSAKWHTFIHIHSTFAFVVVIRKKIEFNVGTTKTTTTLVVTCKNMWKNVRKAENWIAALPCSRRRLAYCGVSADLVWSIRCGAAWLWHSVVVISRWWPLLKLFELATQSESETEIDLNRHWIDFYKRFFLYITDAIIIGKKILLVQYELKLNKILKENFTRRKKNINYGIKWWI